MVVGILREGKQKKGFWDVYKRMDGENSSPNINSGSQRYLN